MSDLKTASETINDPIPNTPSSSEEDLPSTVADPQPSTSALTKELHFSQTSVFPARDVEITNASNQPVYSAKTSQFTPHTPDLVFSTTSRPTLAHVYLRFAGSIRIGIGADDTDMAWTEMKRQTMTGINNAFVFDHHGKRYVLSRNRDVHGMKKAMLGHYKVFEEHSRRLVAIYTADEALGKRRGTLKVEEKIEPELEILIVAGIAAWREKTRRRQRVGARTVI